MAGLAQYLIFPESLDVNTLNAFHHTFETDRNIPYKSFVICQHNSEQFAPYILRFHYRPLPAHILTELSTQLESSGLPKVPESDIKDIHSIKFDVSSGVNDQLIKLNLNALLCTKYLSVDNPNTSTKLFIQNVLWAWFTAIGVTDQIMCSWLQITQENLEQYKPQTIVDSEVKKLTLYPFTSLIDTRFVVFTSHKLFGNKPEEAQYTLQQMEMCFNIQRDSEYKGPAFQLPISSELLNKYGRIFVATLKYKQLHISTAKQLSAYFGKRITYYLI